MSFHKVLLKLHLWTGLASAVFLLVIGITGSIVEWAPEVNRATQPKRVTISPGATTRPVSELIAAAQQRAGKARLLGVNFSERPNEPYTLVFRDLGAGPARDANAIRSIHFFVMNQYTGEVVMAQTPEDRQGGFWQNFMGNTLALHKNLLAGKAGTLIVNYATVIGIFLALSGAYLWWPRKIWWITKGARWRRINFDLHSVVGIYTLVFFFFIALTGAMLHWGQIGQTIIKLAKQQIARVAPARSTPIPGARPLPIDQILEKAKTLPGDYTQNVNIPQRPTDTFNVIRRRHTSGGESTPILAAVDQYSGAVLMLNDASARPWAVRLISNTRAIHDGTLFGMTGRIIATIASTGVPVLVITGFIIWWKRKMTEWQRRWSARSGKPLTKEQLEDEEETMREDLDRVAPATVGAD